MKARFKVDCCNDGMLPSVTLKPADPEAIDEFVFHACVHGSVMIVLNKGPNPFTDGGEFVVEIKKVEKEVGDGDGI